MGDEQGIVQLDDTRKVEQDIDHKYSEARGCGYDISSVIDFVLHHIEIKTGQHSDELYGKVCKILGKRRPLEDELTYRGFTEHPEGNVDHQKPQISGSRYIIRIPHEYHCYGEHHAEDQYQHGDQVRGDRGSQNRKPDIIAMAYGDPVDDSPCLESNAYCDLPAGVITV